MSSHRFKVGEIGDSGVARISTTLKFPELAESCRPLSQDQVSRRLLQVLECHELLSCVIYSLSERQVLWQENTRER